MSTVKVINVIHPSGSTNNIVNDSSGNATIGNNLTVTGGLIPSSSFMRNRIINGAMVIDQRNAGASVTYTNTVAYGVDRWRNVALGTSLGFSVQQVSDAPSGFTNSIKATVTSAKSPASTDQARINTALEGINVADFAFGTASALPVTVSFWVKSSIAGTYCVMLSNAQSGTRSLVAPYTINSANTWERKTITAIGDTTGTWATGTTDGFIVSFNLGSGSFFVTSTTNAWLAGEYHQTSTSTAWIANAGATFNFTGVQLEVGSVATPFEREIYSNTLAKCQRYCYVPAIDSGTGNTWLTQAGAWTAVTGGLFSGAYPVKMRSVPTLATQSSTLSNYAIYSPNGGAYSAVTAISLNGVSSSTVYLINIGTASGGTAGQVGWLVCNSTPNYSLIFSSEL